MDFISSHINTNCTCTSIFLIYGSSYASHLLYDMCRHITCIMTFVLAVF